MKRLRVTVPQLAAALASLPSLALVTTETIGKGPAVPASIELLEPDGRQGFQEDCGVAYFGGDFTTFAKKTSAFSLDGSLERPSYGILFSRATSMG